MNTKTTTPVTSLSEYDAIGNQPVLYVAMAMPLLLSGLGHMFHAILYVGIEAVHPELFVVLAGAVVLLMNAVRLMLKREEFERKLEERLLDSAPVWE